jgi:ABC-type lipoprotein release transport system permease subunit
MAIPLAYNVRNLIVRRWTTVFTMGGIALVVAATMLLAALVGGLQRMLISTGEPDNLVVLRKGATSDGSSQVTRDAAQALRALSSVARDASGEPLASRELVNQPFLRTRAGGRENVLVRGVEPIAFRVHRGVRIVEGRPFRPNLGEVVIGRGTMLRYAPGGVGTQLAFGRRRWTVVGVFDAGGTAFDSEIWADVNDVQDDTRRARIPRPSFAASRPTAASRSRRSPRWRTTRSRPRRRTPSTSSSSPLPSSCRRGRCSARSTRCTPPSRVARQRSERCAPSASDGERSWRPS